MSPVVSKDRTPALLLIVLLIPAAARASESEPDWEARRQEIEQEYIKAFKPPVVGTIISITTRPGREITGRLSEISATKVVVEGKPYVPRQLSDRTCAELFAEHSARQMAARQIQKEKDRYREQRAAEEMQRALTAAAPKKAEAPPPPQQQPRQAVRDNTTIALLGIVGAVVVAVALLALVGRRRGSG